MKLFWSSNKRRERVLPSSHFVYFLLLISTLLTRFKTELTLSERPDVSFKAAVRYYYGQRTYFWFRSLPGGINGSVFGQYVMFCLVHILWISCSRWKYKLVMSSVSLISFFFSGPRISLQRQSLEKHVCRLVEPCRFKVQWQYVYFGPVYRSPKTVIFCLLKVLSFVGRVCWKSGNYCIFLGRVSWKSWDYCILLDRVCWKLSNYIYVG